MSPGGFACEAATPRCAGKVGRVINRQLSSIFIHFIQHPHCAYLIGSAASMLAATPASAPTPTPAAPAAAAATIITLRENTY